MFHHQYGGKQLADFVSLFRVRFGILRDRTSELLAGGRVPAVIAQVISDGVPANGVGGEGDRVGLGHQVPVAELDDRGVLAQPRGEHGGRAVGVPDRRAQPVPPAQCVMETVVASFPIRRLAARDVLAYRDGPEGTFAVIQNPPVVGYVRQANIAHGPQQVNNAPVVTDGATRAGENLNSQNKLLEKKDGERLDPGTACTPGRADPAMATVGEVDRTEDRGR